MQTEKKTHVGIIYPSDPLGTIPGGIETFIRGIIGWAPEDIDISIIGVTTDRLARPVGRWTECRQGKRSFRLLPLFAIDDTRRQPKIPATVMFILRLLTVARKYSFDVLESHRIEPFLPYLFGKTPKNVFLHQNMEVIHSASSDIRWKYFPWLYYKLEDVMLHRLNSVYTVREDAALEYRKRYPDIVDRFNFIPTWVDPDIFFPVQEARRSELRDECMVPLGITAEQIVMIYVGRFDKQKNPLLLVEAFHCALQSNINAHLMMVGDGVLRPELVRRIEELNLSGKVSLPGLKSPENVARNLQAADMFVLSSSYEGMPMCVLEALGCGLPVATTEVGEVRRVVKPGFNGEIASAMSGQELARAMVNCVQNLARYRGAPCLQAVAELVPEKVLKPVYDNYRKLAMMSRANEKT